MINLDTSQNNEAWIRYLQNKDQHEEALRRRNREIVESAYAEERARLEEELQYNKEVFDYKQKKIKEFWDETRKTLGPEILFERIDKFSEEEIEKLYKQIQDRQYQSIVESCILDAKIRDAVEVIPEENFEQPEFSELSQESKDDYIAKTAHTVQMIDYLKYKKSVEGPKVIQKSAVNQATQPSENPATTSLKYISRRDKVARLMGNSLAIPQAMNIGTEFEQETVKSPIQQKLFLPEEQPHEDRPEQRFVPSHELDANMEETPKQFSVKMEKLSPKDRLKEQFNVSKSQHLAYYSNIHNDRHFEEKNFVKKNLDLYRRSPKNLNSQYAEMYDIPEEMPSQSGPPNAFDLSKEPFEGAEELEESFIARLNEKFRNAYLEVNGQKKKYKKRQRSASGISPLKEIPFVQDDTVRESQLISSLMSPHASDLAHLNQRTGLFSSSKDARGREGPYDSSSPQKSSNKKYSDSRRAVREQESQEIKRHKESPSKRGIQMNELFDQFESEFLRTRDQQLEESEREQKLAEEKTESQHSELQQNSAKSKIQEQKRPIINVDETEDFILELTRLVTQGNGIIPSKCQSRLSELVTTSQVAKQDKGVKSKIAEIIHKKTSPKKPVVKLNDHEKHAEVINRQSVDEFNAITVHLSNLGGSLTARYLEFLRARISLESVRAGWTAILALFADCDKLVPTTNGKLNISDETLINYLGQPGRIKTQLQRLPSAVTQNPISQRFLHEFYNAFEHFSSSVSRGGELGDLIHFFRYLYFVRRFIDVARSADLIKVKTEQKNELITRRKNEEYLQNAQKRKEEGRGSVHRDHVREEEEAYGINFVDWEHNLDDIERENKMIQSNLHHEKVKEQHEVKRRRNVEEKEELAHELAIDRERAERAEQLEKERKERERQFLHEKNMRNAEYRKALREQKNQQKKQYEQEIIEQTLIQSEFRTQKLAEQKEQAKQVYQQRKERLKEKKEVKAVNQRLDKQTQKEERVWDKAQRLLQRQRKLLQDRESLNLNAKVSYR